MTAPSKPVTKTSSLY